MKSPNFDFVQAGAVRRAVVPAGDIREDIAFQNDINGLLARFDAKIPPVTALGWFQEPAAPPTDTSRGAGAGPRRTMRVLRGGLGYQEMNDARELARDVLNGVATDFDRGPDTTSAFSVSDSSRAAAIGRIAVSVAAARRS